jgi:outer membrane protein assembly factor BamB
VREVSRRAALRSLGAAGVAGLAGCSALDRLRGPNENPPESVGTDWTAPDDEWRFPDADARNTARVALPAGTAPEPAWRVGGENDIEREPLAATRDAVFVGADGEDRVVVRARDSADGTERWRRAFETRVFDGSGLIDGTLYATTDHELLALDADDGTTRWRVDLYDRLSGTVPSQFLPRERDDFVGRAVATPDIIHVTSGYGLHGLAPGDGTERWRYYLGDTDDRSPPALPRPGGLAVTERAVQSVYRIPSAVYRLRTVGESARVDRERVGVEFPTVPTMTGDPPRVVFGQRVVGTGRRGPAVAGEDGWTFPGFATEGGGALGGIAVADERLFGTQAFARDGRLDLAVFTLKAGTGALVWAVRERLGLPEDADIFDQLGLARPVVAGDSLLVGVRTNPPGGEPERAVAALALADGTERWRVDPGVGPDSLAVAGDRLYVGGSDGGFAALGRRG